MAASRTELLAWLNELLQINYTKVEQCGTGGAYCQVMDSIYGKQLHRNAIASDLMILLLTNRRRANAPGEDVREAGIRVPGEFQSAAEYIQGEED